MSSNTRPSMPPNRRGECRECGQGIPYHGRRDLLELVRSWKRELELSFRNGSALADASIGVLQAAEVVDAAAMGLCVACLHGRHEEPTAPRSSRQLNLIPES